MKFNGYETINRNREVAPLAGAWIEIVSGRYRTAGKAVAPLAGAWIEILASDEIKVGMTSLHSRERGLK